MSSIPVLIAESFDIFDLGVQKILHETPNLIHAGTAKTGKELVKQYRKVPYAVCLISSNMADLNIHEVMQSLRKIQAAPSAIVLTNSADLSHLNQSLKAGVKGYLTKNTPAGELIEAISAVASGEQFFGSFISQLMADKYVDITQKKKPSPRVHITKREKEILNFILDGYTSPEIAKRLYISPRTVETHRSNLMNKLGVKNTAALVRLALEEGEFS
ncbi:MAG: response regulator transcription factor [Balneolaceae bacterium]